ncbi:MAG: hypothetical protein WBL53_03735, partial [Pseudonocardiaceae bacterium]
MRRGAVQGESDLHVGLDRLTQQLFGTNGTTSRPAVMPMDAYRADEQFVVQFDLPGVDPAS